MKSLLLGFVAVFAPALVGVALGIWSIAQGGWVAVACGFSVLFILTAERREEEQDR